MARSTCVYVVLKRGRPIAGFTVKHEMMTWLEKNPDPGYRVWRMPDGLYRTVAPSEIVLAG